LDPVNFVVVAAVYFVGSVNIAFERDPVNLVVVAAVYIVGSVDVAVERDEETGADDEIAAQHSLEKHSAVDMDFVVGCCKDAMGD
jgi:hypothetical protein